jgi:hypothetical protein
MNWIHEEIVPQEWVIDGRNPPRGPYTLDEAGAIGDAACEFVGIKGALRYTEMEARHELAMWLGHNPHRTEVTYAYVPREKTV